MTDPRTYWRPVYGHVFGLKPWDMCDLTSAEVAALNEYLESFG